MVVVARYENRPGATRQCREIVRRRCAGFTPAGKAGIRLNSQDACFQIDRHLVCVDVARIHNACIVTDDENGDPVYLHADSSQQKQHP